MPDDEPNRQARIEDVHEIAMAMPHVTIEYGTRENPVYQVGRKSFVYFRNPRPDAADPETGERYTDVIVIWVESEAAKQALVADGSTPFFTTPHFNGHRSVLVRSSRIGEITRAELAEIIQEAWLSHASARRAAAWLEANPLRSGEPAWSAVGALSDVSREMRPMTVDGETFSISSSEQPGAYRYVWLSGPNNGYGFTSGASDGRPSSPSDHVAAIMNFLEQIDPATGFIADD